jgi:hypothetical protein
MAENYPWCHFFTEYWNCGCIFEIIPNHCVHARQAIELRAAGMWPIGFERACAEDRFRGIGHQDSEAFRSENCPECQKAIDEAKRQGKKDRNRKRRWNNKKARSANPSQSTAK